MHTTSNKDDDTSDISGDIADDSDDIDDGYRKKSNIHTVPKTVGAAVGAGVHLVVVGRAL